MKNEEQQNELLRPLNKDAVDKYIRRMSSPWSLWGFLHRIRQKRRMVRTKRVLNSLGIDEEKRSVNAMDEAKLEPSCITKSDYPTGNIVLQDMIQLEDLPVKNDRNAILAFASTFNGYEYFGSFAACAEAAQSKNRSTISDLRNELFFAARAGNHTGNSQAVVSSYNELLPYFRDLLA